ncbi:Targeting protein for Xklp2-like [Exaiptasia diaphana]|nr:Targeting protein for Xklp2-like [Exaiptasia diaphana]
MPSISKPTTKVEPFNLSADTRGAKKAELWAKKVEDELKEQRKKAVFKAHSSNVLYQAPFVPKKSLKQNTIFDEFNLNSEKRAEERAAYEMHKREREIQDEELILQRQAEKEEEERQNIAMLRKQLVHKANPIRTYKPVAITSSDKQLTIPESPSWHAAKDRKVLRI